MDLGILVCHCRKMGRTLKDVREVGCDISATTVAGSDSSRDAAPSLASSRGVIQEAEDDTERSREVCVGHGKRYIVVVFTGTLLTQLWT